jgi:hypothetical protein
MRYILGVAGLIIVLIVAIILIVTRSPSTSTQQGKKAIALAEYADKDAKVVYTTRGRIVGEESFRSVRVSITRRERVYEVLSGYEDRVQDSKTFSNTDAAYSVFIKALDKAGFARQKNTTIKDETGVCPLGRMFTYDLKEGSTNKEHLWDSSCNKQGSFGGDTSLVQQLFQNQIPDYNKMTENLIF